MLYAPIDRFRLGLFGTNITEPFPFHGDSDLIGGLPIESGDFAALNTIQKEGLWTILKY